MRVAMYYNNNDIRLEETSVPRIGRGEVLMRVRASGICGSDVIEWYRRHKAPLVLGHEVSGEVVETGPEVSRFKVGDRVVAAHHVPCNTCVYCLRGHHTACDTLRATNFDPGGFAEFIRLPAINVDRGTFQIPSGLSFEAATFHEPLGCILRALRNSRFRSGDSVVVLGSGIAGILMVHTARAFGASRVFAVDISEYRLKAAERFGADAAVPADSDLPAELRNINQGRLADIVMVCTGAASAQTQALTLVERGGTVVFFAPTDQGVSFPLSINELFFRNDITLTTSYGAGPRDSWSALELIGTPSFCIEDMITHRLPLERTGEGFRIVAAAQESIKVMITP